jgi:hypothetical protein
VRRVTTVLGAASTRLLFARHPTSRALHFNIR